MSTTSTLFYNVRIEDLKDGCSRVQDYDDLMSKLAYFKDNLEELYNKKTKGYSSLPDKI
jgi:hypothetical protein